MLHDYGYGVVCGLIMLEAMGLPLPGETIMVAAALYAARTHHLTLVPLLAAACGGAVAGSAMGYLIGRRVGGHLLVRYGPRLGLTEDRRLLGQYLMQRNGAALVFCSRFIAVLRAVAGLMAGANQMDWRRFMLFNLLGGAAWTGLYCGGTYALGQAVMDLARPAGIAIGTLACVLAVVAFLWVRRHERRLIQAALSARGDETR